MECRTGGPTSIIHMPLQSYICYAIYYETETSDCTLSGLAFFEQKPVIITQE